MIDTIINYLDIAFKLFGGLMVISILYKKYTKGGKPTKWDLFYLIMFLT